MRYPSIECGRKLTVLSDPSNDGDLDRMIRYGAARALTDSDKDFYLCNKLTEKQIENANNAQGQMPSWMRGRCKKRFANWIGPQRKPASFVYDLGCNTSISYLALRNSLNGYFNDA